MFGIELYKNHLVHTSVCKVVFRPQLLYKERLDALMLHSRVAYYVYHDLNRGNI